MEVTRKNFKEALPLISESISKADFLVIDAEFTGLIHGRDVSMFDSPKEYYCTLLNGSADFLLIQFGLCAFHWSDERKCYMNDAYNFYVFPRGRPGPEKIFVCQSSSMDFLSSQGFDFNKLVKEGISYMTEPVETRLRENLTERQKSGSEEKDVITIPKENKSQIDEICTRVREFLDENKSDEMEIDRCNAFIRRLLFQEIRIRFKHEVFVETKILENANRVLKVTRVKSASESKLKDEEKKKKEWEELEEAVGFSKVAKMISQSEKLVVGHNMLLDVLHTLNHFFQPLPSDYESFKEFTKFVFPRLLDTKYMSSLPPFKDKVNSTVLSHLLGTLSEPPFSVPKVECLEGRGYGERDDKHHEAGYDAYITGLCFLAMHAYTSGLTRVTSTELNPYINKLFLAKTAHQDSPFINLDGPDPSPSRFHVFHLTFPKEWQRNDINQLFKPYGQITVQFIDDTSAFVALTRKDLAETMVKALSQKRKISIIPYIQYKILMNKKAAPEKRKQSSAPVDMSHAQTPDSGSRTRQGKAAPDITHSTEKPRRRSRSVASPETVPPARKRTSSGVFQVEESEPPNKKFESVCSESTDKTATVSNGRQKNEKRKRSIGEYGK